MAGRGIYRIGGSGFPDRAGRSTVPIERRPAGPATTDGRAHAYACMGHAEQTLYLYRKRDNTRNVAFAVRR